MTDQPSVTILNVGHGLCGVLQDKVGTMLFDVAPGPVPRDFLRTLGVDNLDAVMLSHFHKDHCSGMTGFLGKDYEIGEVFMNHPRAEEKEVFEQITAALVASRNRRGKPKLRPFDTDVDRPVLDRGPVQVQVITPDAVAARSRKGLHGRRAQQTEHSVCGVARIVYEGHPRVLLGGDLDRGGVEAILERDPELLRADVLVYPHHGGDRSERNEEEFAALLSGHVQPKLIVFSMSREKGERPHPEVLKGIASLATSPGVVCTQLSKLCDERNPGHGARLEPLPMQLSSPPHQRRLCCGGSIMIPLDGPESAAFVGDEEHLAFVEGPGVPEPMCRP